MPPRILIAALLAAIAIAGCGSSKKSSSAATASNTTATSASSASSKLPASFIARVNAICAKATKNAPKFQYPNFDPTRPDVKLLPKIGAFFQKRQAVADHVPVELRDLGTPSSAQATWGRIVALAAQNRAIADQQIKAALASDSKAFVATLGPIQP